MIFDAFLVDGNILSSNRYHRWKNKLIAVILKTTDHCLDIEDIKVTRQGLVVEGKKFEYLSMDNCEYSVSRASVLQVDIPKEHWSAQKKALLDEMVKHIDTEYLRNELSGLPFKSAEAALIFYLNEFFFCSEQGAIPLGLCLLEKTPSALEHASHLGIVSLDGIT